jgi:WD40 repeat protein
MSQFKRKRHRGVVLTPHGLSKLQEAKLKSEQQENFADKYTYEQISELTNLDLNTIKKILERRQGVDKRSLEKFCLAFNLELLDEFYTKPNLNQRHDWGEAIQIDDFVGRTQELQVLTAWLLEERCRLIAILGMGGMGKTTLSIKLAQQVASEFDCVIWKSLRDAPPVEEIVTDLIEFLSAGRETAVNLPTGLGKKISRLMDYLRSERCLILLDNTESLMDDNHRAGKYGAQYAGYGELIKRIGATSHNSCLILTSREKPQELAVLEGDISPVRSWQLKGLKEGHEIIKVKGLLGSTPELNNLSDRYGGNPLALKVVAATIKDLFGGNITEFLHQEKSVFGDIRDLLDQQFERLSDLEQQIMYWIAISREPVSLARIQENFVFQVDPIMLVEAIDSLSRRSLIENSEALFTQQPVVMEYLASRLVEKVSQEIIHLKPQLLRNYALIKATAKDYIRENQIRLVLQPVINQLLATFRNKQEIATRLGQILRLFQETSPLEESYGAGNIINLLCQMKIDLTDYDFSHLCVWQADLRQTKLHQVNFSHANLAKSLFAENFGGVWSVAFSPDGAYLAAGDTKGNILLRRMADGQPMRIFTGHHAWVVSLAFSPDGKILASASCDCTAKLWDLASGQCLHSLEEHQQEVWSVTFSPDGKTLASGCDDGKARIWNVATGECLQIFQGHLSEVLSVAFSLDGQKLISGSQDRTIRLWNIKLGVSEQIFAGHEDGVRSISLSPDGQILASASSDRTIRLWNLQSGKCLQVLQGHSTVVLSVAFSPHHNLLASSSIGHKVRLWDATTGECLKILSGHTNTANSVAFSPQDNILASGSYDQTVKLWHLNTYQCLKTWQGYSNQALSIAFSADGATLFSGGHDGAIRLWDVNSGTVRQTLSGHTNWVFSVAFSSSQNLLASGSADKTIKLWDVNTGELIQTFWGHEAGVRSIAFAAAGQILASGSEDGTVRLWDTKTGQALQVLRGHRAEIWSIALSDDGRLLASACLDSTIKLWNLQADQSGKCLRTLEGHESWVWSVALSPDNQTLVSTSIDQTIRFWQLNTGECQNILREDIGNTQLVAFSLDGQILASCNQDHDIRLWQVSTGKLIRQLQGHTALINSLVFSPDGQTIASSSEDETIKFWDLTTAICVKTLKPKNPYAGMSIRGVTGLSTSAMEALKNLGATTTETK